MVRAATDLQLHSLTCEQFLPVVTGFPLSARQARASVDTMLERARRARLTTHACPIALKLQLLGGQTSLR
jgi:hypothetical protein